MTPDLFDEMYNMWDCSCGDNPLVEELKMIDALLDKAPEILDAVHADLNAHLKGKKARKKNGREAEINAEQALRCAILKQLKTYSYRALEYEILASPLYRVGHEVSAFTRFYHAKIPHFTTIERAIK